MARPTHSFFRCWLPALGIALLAAPAARAAPIASDDGGRIFEKQVKPILVANCLKCHGGEVKVKGELRLTSRESLTKGGDRGPVVSADQPEKSLLLEAVQYHGDLKMPPNGKLPNAEIETLSQWVKRGAPWPASVDLTPPEVTAALKNAPAVRHGPPSPAEARDFWSFRPITRPAAPDVKDKSWVKNPVDAFVLSKLEAKGIAPAPPADNVTLIRRVYYDLTGLPPPPAEIDAFIRDPSPRAYENLIDRLLASPHYGEKWGRYWLDLVRYGESNSYERDNPKPNVWRYRDYVIRSFNADKPYDEFVREQLAGDEMPDAATNPDRLIATGIYRLGIWDDDPADKEQARFDELDDIVTTTGQVFLGLTVDCARCHDHKIDPIPQSDYYKLVAFFRNINPYRNGGPTDERSLKTVAGEAPAAEIRRKQRAERREQIESETLDIQHNFQQILQGDPHRGEVEEKDLARLIRKEGATVLGASEYARYKALTKDLEDLLKPDPEADAALCVTEHGSKAPDTFILSRGNAAAPGQKVEPGFLAVVGSPDPVIAKAPAGSNSSGRRTVLANWITAADNPLPARVMANRVFQYHFGRGIVRSSNNFGLQGDKPTHPELLDWLASELIHPSIDVKNSSDNAWRLKPLHRLIMTSNAYRMSSRGDDQALAMDPQNDLLWHFDLRRLTAEEVRDSILSLNGSLNPAMFGPSVYPPIPKEVMAGQSRPGDGWLNSNPEDSARRSVYVHVKRSLRVPLLEAFDAAETDRSCPVRFVTVQPTQALEMLNGSFLHEAAAKFAARVQQDAGPDTRAQVTLTWRLATGRVPNDEKVEQGLKLLDDLEHKDDASADQAMKYFCLMVLNLNEFVYVD